jgi:hypothetical protein
MSMENINLVVVYLTSLSRTKSSCSTVGSAMFTQLSLYNVQTIKWLLWEMNKSKGCNITALRYFVAMSTRQSQDGFYSLGRFRLFRADIFR